VHCDLSCGWKGALQELDKHKERCKYVFDWMKDKGMDIGNKYDDVFHEEDNDDGDITPSVFEQGRKELISQEEDSRNDNTQADIINIRNYINRSTTIQFDSPNPATAINERKDLLRRNTQQRDLAEEAARFLNGIHEQETAARQIQQQRRNATKLSKNLENIRRILCNRQRSESSAGFTAAEYQRHMNITDIGRLILFKNRRQKPGRKRKF